MAISNASMRLLASAIFALSVLPVIATAKQPWADSAKRGVGMSLRADVQVRNLQRLEELDTAWFYSWGAEPLSGYEALPQGISFVPMAWGRGGLTGAPPTKVDNWIDGRDAGLYDTLLGFNEPDHPGQANMTVNEALDLWPLLESTGLRLGSPAAAFASGTWIQQFMDGVAARDLQVDFLAVHRYGGSNPQSFLNLLDNLHAQYNRPIWITEFGVADWQANTPEDNRYTDRQVFDFMAEVLPALEQRDYIERYAWFPAPRSNSALTHSALYEDNGELSRLGRLYQGRFNRVFEDNYQTDAVITGDLNAEYEARQESGLVLAQYASGGNSASAIPHQVRRGRLTLIASAPQSATEPANAWASLDRDLQAELAGSHWQLHFEAYLLSDTEDEHSHIDVSLGDEMMNSPYVSLLRDGLGQLHFTVGSSDPIVSQIPASSDGIDRFVMDIDETTGVESQIDLIVNGVKLVTNQLVNMNTAERFFRFTGQAGTGHTSTSILDNVSIELLEEISADFDLDGHIDENDLSSWKSSFGTGPGADADADGDTDGADFLAWQRQFEADQGAATISENFIVPEPLSATLLLLGMLLFGRNHRCKHNASMSSITQTV